MYTDEEQMKNMIPRTNVHTIEIPIPEGLNVTIDGKSIMVSGPLGSCKKDFANIPVAFQLEKEKILCKINVKGKKGLSLKNTLKAIIENLFIGVTKGYVYKMKVFSLHFPITVNPSDSYVTIKNFGGERGLKRSKIMGDTKVKVEGEDIIISGVSKEDVGLTTANIRQICKIKSKDPRIFLDGIYVYSKGGK